jgi:hypothetical protein
LKQSNTIFGDDDGPVQWALSYDHDTKNVAIICLENYRTQKVLEYYEILCEQSVSDAACSNKYKTMIGHYRTAISILRQKELFTDDKIVEFQLHIDHWF